MEKIFSPVIGDLAIYREYDDNGNNLIKMTWLVTGMTPSKYPGTWVLSGYSFDTNTIEAILELFRPDSDFDQWTLIRDGKQVYP